MCPHLQRSHLLQGWESEAFAHVFPLLISRCSKLLPPFPAKLLCWLRWWERRGGGEGVIGLSPEGREEDTISRLSIHCPFPPSVVLLSLPRPTPPPTQPVLWGQIRLLVEAATPIPRLATATNSNQPANPRDYNQLTHPQPTPSSLRAAGYVTGSTGVFATLQMKGGREGKAEEDSIFRLFMLYRLPLPVGGPCIVAVTGGAA